MKLIDENLQIKDQDINDIFKASKYTILYFYPKDNTPGCSIEAKDFSTLKSEFDKLGVQIVGVSKDSISSHQKFIEKLCIRFPLISDEDLSLHRKYGAWGEKKTYGKVTQGTIRSTFFVDSAGNIVKQWLNVKATGHAQNVLDQLKQMFK